MTVYGISIFINILPTLDYGQELHIQAIGEERNNLSGIYSSLP